ncbi:MAG: TIGR03435 family protein [Bryobacteraceae bacterium]
MTGPAIRAQSAAAATLKFEVASVKPCKTEDGGGGGRMGGGGGSPSPGRLHLTCRTVMDLVRMAFLQYADGKSTPPGRHVPVSGGPAWIDSDRYDIDATAEGAPGQAMMSGPMIQALLEDRFKLKIHRETREVPVYAMTVSKGGARLQVGQPGKCFTWNPGHPVPPSQRPPGLSPCGVFAPSPAKDGSYMYGTTLANFCVQLSLVLDRDVIDKTAIAGVFDIHVEAPPADDPAGDATYPASPTDALGSAIFDAVQKLGLKLEPAKGSGELLVIDRVEKPSGN